MTTPAAPEDRPLTGSEKVKLSEFAATLVAAACQQNGTSYLRAPADKQPAPVKPGDREHHRYVESLIQDAVKAGLGTNPHAHAYLAHELDYFSGRPRILGFEDDPDAQAND